MSSQHLLRDRALRYVACDKMRDKALTCITRTHALLREQRARAAALHNELKALERDMAVSSSKEQEACQTLAKAECTQLCDRIITQLPRELRDMVYHHLSTRSEERISRKHYRSTMDPQTRMYAYDADRSRVTHYPEHYWDASYVGNDFYRELVENYYRTSTFVFGDDSGLMERFLHTDQLKLGYAPQELVSKIEVRLNAITHDRTSCIGYMFGCATKPERLQAALGEIQGLRPGSSICVHLSTQARDEKARDEQVMAGCAALVPGLREARGLGYEVLLIVDRKVRIELDDVSDGYSLVDRT
jgi:hypothetical protein